LIHALRHLFLIHIDRHKIQMVPTQALAIRNQELKLGMELRLRHVSACWIIVHRRDLSSGRYSIMDAFTHEEDALQIMRCFKKVVTMINQGQEEAREWMHARAR